MRRPKVSAPFVFQASVNVSDIDIAEENADQADGADEMETDTFDGTGQIFIRA